MSLSIPNLPLLIIAMAATSKLVFILAVLLLVSGHQASAAANDDPAPYFLGKWELLPNNPGISAMHSVLLPNVDEMVIFDATVWQISRLPLPDYKRPCPMHQNKATNVTNIDCWCHSVFYNVNTLQVTPLKVITDTWCSSGGLDVNGNLISTGGFLGGSRTTRYLWGCPTCDWTEYPTALKDGRWYATQVLLADGSFLIFGGRDSFSYEYIPAERTENAYSIPFQFLRDTYDVYRRPGQDDFRLENNLYPFVYLVPDGNLYIFANNRSILLDPRANYVLREYPPLPGGARNYPSTSTSVLLPLKLYRDYYARVDAEVLICGGSVPEAFYFGEVEKRLVPALDDCARMVVTSPDPVWTTEKMPTPRVMSDGVLLPTGDVLLINGAELGSAGWKDADKPCFKPLLYKPSKPPGSRFTELAPSDIPRMYHSVANLLPDGRVFVGGSNDNDGYQEWAKFPTELRLEKFSPPYLAPELADRRTMILVDETEKAAPYGKWVGIKVKSAEMLNEFDLMVTMIAPPFVTHSISMNQRLIELAIIEIKNDVYPGVHEVVVAMPPSGNIAPPGYYMLSVVLKGIPSPSMWFQVK